jgi:hypothetical protein
MINQQVSALRPNVTELQLKSMDWALPAGHSLAVEVGTIQAGIPSTNDWLLTVSGQEVTVRGTQLDLALDDPAKDSAIPGTPAPWMHLYRLSQTSKPTATPPSFTLS